MFKIVQYEQHLFGAQEIDELAPGLFLAGQGKPNGLCQHGHKCGRGVDGGQRRQNDAIAEVVEDKGGCLKRQASLPLPPGPTRLISRQSGSCRRRRIVFISCVRPINGVSGAGRLWRVPWNTPSPSLPAGCVRRAPRWQPPAPPPIGRPACAGMSRTQPAVRRWPPAASAHHLAVGRLLPGVEGQPALHVHQRLGVVPAPLVAVGQRAQRLDCQAAQPLALEECPLIEFRAIAQRKTFEKVTMNQGRGLLQAGQAFRAGSLLGVSVNLAGVQQIRTSSRVSANGHRPG